LRGAYVSSYEINHCALSPIKECFFGLVLKAPR
jgi:hypothetical protein